MGSSATDLSDIGRECFGLDLLIDRVRLGIGIVFFVESEKIQRSTFRVEFPRACEQAPESRAEGGSPVTKGETPK